MFVLRSDARQISATAGRSRLSLTTCQATLTHLMQKAVAVFRRSRVVRHDWPIVAPQERKEDADKPQKEKHVTSVRGAGKQYVLQLVVTAP